MRRAFKAYQTASGHWQTGPENPGDTVWRISMPDINRFCGAMSNFQDELSPPQTVPGDGFGLSALAFMSQIFDFNTGPYDSYINGDGTANEAERKERADGVGTSHGHLPLKTANFSGVSGLVLYMKNLTEVVQTLKAAKRFREAGIVQFAIDQVATLKWSITTALAYLRDNLPTLF